MFKNLTRDSEESENEMEEEYSRTSRKRKVPLRFLESSEAEDSSSEEIGGEKDLCKICGKKKAPQTKRKKGRDMWVACDIYEFWFHVVYMRRGDNGGG